MCREFYIEDFKLIDGVKIVIADKEPFWQYFLNNYSTFVGRLDDLFVQARQLQSHVHWLVVSLPADSTTSNRFLSSLGLIQPSSHRVLLLLNRQSFRGQVANFESKQLPRVSCSRVLEIEGIPFIKGHGNGGQSKLIGQYLKGFVIGGKIVEGEPVVKGIFKISVAPDTSCGFIYEVSGFGFNKLNECLISRGVCLVAKQAISPEIQNLFSIDYAQPASARGLGPVDSHSIYQALRGGKGHKESCQQHSQHLDYALQSIHPQLLMKQRQTYQLLMGTYLSLSLAQTSSTINNSHRLGSTLSTIIFCNLPAISGLLMYRFIRSYEQMRSAWQSISLL